ncbi:hypothetical protein ASZ90_017644 [hydrocarbon metagenome]|uniref:Uncharacterized protein n=1 Tax=hydrocarbon metagenome TaxID=938273 RepID=A0A0W8E8E3_9ZZZZ
MRKQKTSLYSCFLILRVLYSANGQPPVKVMRQFHLVNTIMQDPHLNRYGS